jgi:hypothetical protein
LLPCRRSHHSSSLPLPKGLPASVDSMLQQAVSTRPDLAAKFAEVRACEVELERACADYLPKLSANHTPGRVYLAVARCRVKPGRERMSESSI